MSITVPSNHTRIRVWVNSKMSARNRPVYYINRHAGISNKNRRHDKLYLQNVQDTVIHLEVDEEQWKITQGIKR